MESIKEAKDYLRDNFEEGSDCPCCGQYVKLYKRKLTSSMAYALYLIYQKDERLSGFFHVEDYFKSIEGLPSSVRGDFAKLRHWDLIRKLDHIREDGSPRNGYYRITDKGRRFIKNGIFVESHVFLFDSKLKGRSADLINFQQSLGNKFNFNELMGNI